MLSFCKRCHELKELAGRGLCNACYQKATIKGTRKNFKKDRVMADDTFICKQCKQEKKHYGKGLCEACWKRPRQVGATFGRVPVHLTIDPADDKKEYEDIAKETMHKMLEDLKKNPRKWLNNVKSKTD